MKSSRSRGLTLYFLVLFSLVIMGQMPPARLMAQGSPALVRTEPAILEMEAGQTYEVPVLLENAFETFAIDVRMRFDPTMVEVVDAIPELDGTQILQGNFPQPDFAAQYAADNGLGTINYVVTQIGSTPPASGSGTVLTIQLRARQSGESLLRFEKVEMANRDGLLLDVTTQDMQLSIAGAAALPTTGSILVVPTATAVTAPTDDAQVPTAFPTATVMITPASGERSKAPTTRETQQTPTVGPTPLPTATGRIATLQPAPITDQEQASPPPLEAPGAAFSAAAAETTDAPIENAQAEAAVATPSEPDGQEVARAIAADDTDAKDARQAPVAQVIGADRQSDPQNSAGTINNPPETTAGRQTDGSRTTVLLLAALAVSALAVIGLIALLVRRST